jgi:hypothetical protein
MKNFLHSCIAAMGACLMHLHVIAIIPQDQINTLIAALVSIIAGLITACLSKLLHKWFDNQNLLDANDKLNRIITDLQTQLHSSNNQPSINK